MNTPTKNDLIQKLYEIPACTICLGQLDKEITNLACGHCFHFICINQHIQYKANCPNCQKRTSMRQARTVYYQPILNQKAGSHLQLILSTLSQSDGKRMEQILKQVKIYSESAERYKNENRQLESQIKTKNNFLENIKEENSRKKNQIQRFRKENLQLINHMQDMKNKLDQSQSTKSYLRNKVQKFQNQLRDYELFKKYKKALNDNSEQLIKLRTQMEYNGTPPEIIIKHFFQLCQMAKLQQGKNKQKIRDLNINIQYYQDQKKRLLDYNQKLEKDIRKLNESLQTEKKKIELIQYKYRQTSKKSINNEEKEDSILLSNTCRKMVKVQTQKSISPFLNTNKTEQSLQNSVKKPTFTASSKIGGLTLRKKEDSINLLNMK